MDIDQAFDRIGHLGPGQSLQMAILSGTVAFNSWIVCLPVFTQFEIETPEPQNYLNQTLPVNSTQTVNLKTNPIPISSDFNMNTFQLHLVTSLFMAGVMFGNPIFGYLSDKYGRRKILLNMLLLTSVCTIGSAIFSVGWKSYLFWRILVGAGRSAIHNSLMALVYEFVGNSYYARLEFIACVSWSFGMVVLSWLAEFYRYWRHLSIVTALPGFVLFYLVKQSPESPRWLYTNNRITEAENILKNIGRGNGKSESELELVLEPVVTNEDNVRNEGFMRMIKSGVVMKRVGSMMVVFFTGSLVYFGITFGTQQLGGSVYTNLQLSALSEIPGGFIGFIIMQTPFMGRKRTLMLFLMLVGFGSYLLDVYHLNGDSKRTIAFLSKTLIEGTWAVNNPYSIELFPTSVRSVALGMLNFSSQLSGVLAPFLQDFGKVLIDPDDPDAPFVFYAIVALLSCVMVGAMLPETLNAKTHDTISSLETDKGARKTRSRTGSRAGYKRLATDEL